MADTQDIPSVNRYITRAQLAEKLQVNKRVLDNYIRRGLIPEIKLGGVSRFNWEIVRRSLEENFMSEPDTTGTAKPAVNSHVALKAFCRAVDPNNQPKDKDE